MSTATADEIRVLSPANVTRYGEHHCSPGEITDEQEAREIAAEILREAS